MSPLTYLSLTRLKNGIRDVLRKPSRLIYVLFLIALCVFAAVGSASGGSSSPPRNPTELTAIVTGLYLVMFWLTAWNGFSKGGGMFTMSDINLVFPAPVSRTRALFYGLFRQISTSLLLGLFIFYQYSWLHNLYGVSFAALVGIFFGYVAVVFLGQVTAMTIYAFTSSSEPLQRILKGLFFLLLLLMIGCILYEISKTGTSSQELLTGLFSAVNGSLLAWFPVGGWLGHTFASAIAGSLWLPGPLLCVVWLAVLMRLLTYFDKDWYEDVIQTAELAQSAIAAKKEGNLDAAPRNIKVGAVGLSQGFGANSFYYKHKLENRRGNIFLLSRSSLIFAVIIIAFAFFMRDSSIIAVFCFATYMQLFSTSQTRLNKELTKPFLYLVPEPPFSKLLHCLREMLPSALTEAVVVFLPVGLILGLDSYGIIVCILARISFALLFQAGNLVIDRFWSGVSKVLTVFLYFVLMIALSAPGVVAGCLVVFLLSVPGGFLTGLLVAAVVNVPVGFFILFLCRNMLEYAELNS